MIEFENDRARGFRSQMVSRASSYCTESTAEYVTRVIIRLYIIKLARVLAEGARALLE